MTVRAGTFSLEINGCDAELRLAGFRGEEGISQLYRFEIDFLTPGTHLNPESTVGSPVHLHIGVGDDRRVVHGVVISLSHGPITKDWARQQLVLGPPMRRLELRHDCRIFQEMTVSEVIAEVFKSANMTVNTDFRLSLSATYEKRVYCVQYRESDWNFISRLLEEEGIFYYFEHGDDSACLVLCDDSSTCPPIPGDEQLRYHPGGAAGEQTSVASFHATAQMVTNAAALRDYDFRRPALDLLVKATGDTSQGVLERYDYPGGYESPSPGARRAKLLLQASLATQCIAQGSSDCARLVPGTSFTLDDLSGALCGDLLQPYLIVGLASTGDEADPLNMGGGGTYRVTFRCVPASVPYRPAIVTPRPTIHGVQTAIVTGKEEIFVDEFGRIKVQFHWDRLGKHDDRSSCWIRVSQPWAGEGWGAMFLPRRGQEVIVSFIEGDPDRPIVTGRVYNGDSPVPYALPGDRTRSTIMSRSSPDARGSNELRFEDLADKEEVYLHAQKDWTIAVENDKNQTIGHDETLTVKHDRTTNIEHNQSETIGADKTITVKANHTETIDGDMTLAVKKNQTSTIDGDLALTVNKGRETTIEADEVLAIHGKRSETITGNNTLEVQGDVKEAVGGALTITVTGDTALSTDAGYKLSAARNIAIDATGKLSLDTQQGLTVASKAKAAVEAAQELTLTCGAASITLKASGEIMIKGLKVTLSAGAEIKLAAPKIAGG